MPRLKPLWLHLGDLAGRLRCAGHLGIASDFDGTLTPIVPEPDGARLAPRSRDLLERLVARSGVSLAILSGRRLEDLEERVGLRGVFYAGTAGFETRDPSGGHAVHLPPGAEVPAELREELERWCDRFPGAWLEDKRFSYSLHYRAVERSAQPAFGAGVRRRVHAHPRRARLVHGKRVFEVMPAPPWDKSSALERWLAGLPQEALTFYFGDDSNDEPVHARVRQQGGVSVAVGRASSHAEYGVPTCADVAWFLEWLEREHAAGQHLRGAVVERQTLLVRQHDRRQSCAPQGLGCRFTRDEERARGSARCAESFRRRRSAA